MKSIEHIKIVVRRVSLYPLKIIKKLYFEAKLFFSKTISVSIGENCLVDNILERHGKKMISSPYSHGRSNLDYAIKLEKENYTHLMDTNHFTHHKVGDTPVIRNMHNFTSDNIYLDLHQNGFEFTHHDVMENKSHIKSYKRKISRLIKYKGKKNFHFYYHYRANKNLNIDLLFLKAEKFLSYYQINNKKCEITIFTQNKVDSLEERRTEVIKYSENIRAYIFHTLHFWSGDDQDIFWARNDDDLIKSMF